MQNEDSNSAYLTEYDDDTSNNNSSSPLIIPKPFTNIISLHPYIDPKCDANTIFILQIKKKKIQGMKVIPSLVSSEAKLHPMISPPPEPMFLTISLKHLPRIVVIINCVNAGT